ncbi:MAG TPA: hypothetical protein VD833_00095 [Vicinamibacterales bacterium]|nr:hypothetical protein [Vicinamibacterales bacterium]
MIVAFVRAPQKPIVDVDEILRDRHAGVRCPRCGWRPTRQDLWGCNPGCGHVWHTFDTHGECPGCSKQWSATQCLRCQEWSDHDAWYEDEEGDRDG